MKSWLAGLSISLLLLVPLTQVHAEYVSGYMKSNGTYVQGYERPSPDGDPFNNYDYPGSYNPNTGSITGGSDTTYLNDYYDKSSSDYDYGDDDYSDDFSSYLDTPSCPLDSYSDGTSCKCDAGYTYSGGSCVSNDEYCDDQMGLMSEYNYLTGTCGCMAGYTYDGASCVYDTPTYDYDDYYSA